MDSKFLIVKKTYLSFDGMSLLELLISLAIISPIFLASFKLISSSSFYKVKSEYTAKNDYNVEAVKSLIEKIFNNLDEHRFLIEPRIHKRGLITYSNGEKNPVMSSNRKPSKSDALSTLRLSIFNTHIVKEVKELELTACPIYKKKYPRTSIKSYLGISNNGFMHLSGTETYNPQTRCRNYKLKETKSMVIKKQNFPLSFVNLIIPIIEEYTLYIDQNNILRYLGHSAHKNIENQPILENFGSLKIIPSASKNKPFTTFTIKYKNKNYNREFVLNNNLARHQHFNFLLHAE